MRFLKRFFLKQCSSGLEDMFCVGLSALWCAKFRCVELIFACFQVWRNVAEGLLPTGLPTSVPWGPSGWRLRQTTVKLRNSISTTFRPACCSHQTSKQATVNVWTYWKLIWFVCIYCIDQCYFDRSLKLNDGGIFVFYVTMERFSGEINTSVSADLS